MSSFGSYITRRRKVVEMTTTPQSREFKTMTSKEKMKRFGWSSLENRSL